MGANLCESISIRRLESEFESEGEVYLDWEMEDNLSDLGVSSKDFQSCFINLLLVLARKGILNGSEIHEVIFGYGSEKWKTSVEEAEENV
jgi:hypothetical protein